MSISGEIERIEQNIANTYAVLSALGADIPAEQNSDNLATTAGTAKAVLYSEQSLTTAQKAQARENIGVTDWFTAGTSIPSDSDLDTYTTAGKYYVSSTAISNTILNAPVKGTNYTLFVFIRTATKSITQLVVTLANRMYIRSAPSSGVLSDWLEVASMADVQSVRAVVNDLEESLGDYLLSSELSSAIETALAEAKASGEFDGATGATGATGAQGEKGEDGYTPVKGVDYYTDADKAEWEAYIASELAAKAQLEPAYPEGETVEECLAWLAESGDQNKLYILPDGFIYAYLASTGPSYTNLSETVHENYRMGSGGTLSALAGAITTDFIPVKKGQTVRFKGFNPLVMPSGKYPYICFYTGASESNVLSSNVWDRLDYLKDFPEWLKQEDDGTWVYIAFGATSSPGNVASGYSGQHIKADEITHIRMCGTMLDGETVIVTVDEEITEGGGSGGYAWQSTGHAFVPADYEEEINKKANKTDIPTALKNPYALTINGTAYDGSKAVEVNLASSGNILEGKKWVACGDSFTEGGYNASDGFAESVYKYQDGRFTGQNIVYPFIIGLRNNMEIVNLATGGQTMAASDNSFMTRYTTIDADADYITIALGINDKLQSIPVGTISDNTNTTFCGAYNIALKHIIENHPFAHIGLIAINGTNEEIMQATRDIAEWWGLPCLDFGSNEVPLFNRYTGRNVNPEVVKIREKNFCVISDGVTPTNAHPNTAAHEYESTFIENWLRSL